MRSKCGSSSGGVATSRRPFVGSTPGSMRPVCPIGPSGTNAGRSAASDSALHEHTRFSYAHADVVAAGRDHRCLGVHRSRVAPPRRRSSDMDVVVATGDSMAGRRAADVYPSLEVAYPDLVFEAFDPADGRWARRRVPRSAARGVDGARAAARRLGRLRRRPVGGVPAEGRRGLSHVLRLRPHPTRPARRGGVRPARTASDGAEGGAAHRHTRLPRHRGHAGPAAPRRRRPRRADRDRREHRHRHHRGRARPDRHERVHQHRLQRRRLRADRSPPHARDGAGDRCPADLHPASRPDEPRPARHVLRPADRRMQRRARSPPRCTTSPSTSRSSPSPPSRRRPSRCSAPMRRTSAPASTSAPARSIAMCAIDNLTKGASGGALQAANVALGLDETAGLSSIGLAP